MSDVRVTRGENGGEAARLLAASARRQFSAARQLGISDAHRLTEWQLTTIRRLFSGMVRIVEDELRAAVAERFAAYPALHAALGSRDLAIATPVVERGDLASDPALISHLVRRLEEHRIHRSSAGLNESLLAALIRDTDEGLATDAMALLIAQSRRLDRFQEPLMARTELPGELQHRLVWTVAAALRVYMVDCHRVAPGLADEALSEAADAMIAAYQEAETLEARCMSLARRAASSLRLDDQFAERALTGGSLPLFIAAMAVRSGLAFDAAWDVVSDPDARGPALLLRAATVARQPAGSILLALGGEAMLAGQLDLYDSTHPEEARQALLLWRIDPAYRAALTVLLEPEAA